MVKKGKIFHGEDLRVIKEIIPSDSSVLEIGCGNGNLIGKLNVTKAVGVDVSDKLIELAKKISQSKFFCDDINSYSKKLLSKDKFDFILISDTVGYFYDIQILRINPSILQTRNKDNNFLFFTNMATNTLSARKLA